MDPAFVWQNTNPPPPPRRWVPIEDAATLAGVDLDTVEQWVRSGQMTARRTDDGLLVLRSDIPLRRARRDAPASEPQPATPDSGRQDPPPPPVPEGSMLVPIDEWRRLLNQLGNLHEAGQQVAEARERAARAETEAEFLRERVRELRRRLEESTAPESPPEPPPEPPAAPEPADDPVWLYALKRLTRRR